MSLTDKLKKPSTIIIIGILILAVVGIVTAATILYNPVDENPQGTPVDKPTPTPTATPTPTEPPPVVPTEVHLSSNNTTPFYKGDTLTMTAQLNQPVAGITITLYNNGNLAANPTAITDALGKATFNRNPTLPYNYSVTANIP